MIMITLVDLRHFLEYTTQNVCLGWRGLGQIKGEGEDERQWGVREVIRSHFFDYDVLYVLLIRAISQNVSLLFQALCCAHGDSFKSLRVYISSVALYVDCCRETGNLGHL